MVLLRGVCVPARDAALYKMRGAGDSFSKNPCVWHISCAIFTKYMIHRFIKHGKRFVENFKRNISILHMTRNMQEIVQDILQFRRRRNAKVATIYVFYVNCAGFPSFIPQKIFQQKPFWHRKQDHAVIRLIFNVSAPLFRQNFVVQYC